jgi:hypothetical protein
MMWGVPEVKVILISELFVASFHPFRTQQLNTARKRKSAQLVLVAEYLMTSLLVAVVTSSSKESILA